MNCRTHVLGQSEDTSEWSGITTKANKRLSTTRPKMSEKSSRTASNPAPTVLWALQSFRQTAQISFYHVREFLLVDHSSSLNKVIHTESYCTDVLHMKWQSTGQDPEELDFLMNQFYVQPLFQHCLGLLVLKISQTENLCQVTSLIGVRDRTCQNISSGFLPNQTHDFKQTFNMWQYICQNIYHLYAHTAVLECSGNPTINARGKKD